MPAGVSVPSLARANASIALPLAEFVMVYTAPAAPGVSAAWAGPAKAASPPAVASPMAPAAAARIRRGIALRLLTAVSLNMGLLRWLLAGHSDS